MSIEKTTSKPSGPEEGSTASEGGEPGDGLTAPNEVWIAFDPSNGWVLHTFSGEFAKERCDGV